MELLEIERELAGPDAQATMERYDQILAALDARVSSALKAGLPPDEYRRSVELQNANVIARKLLRLQVRQTEAERFDNQTNHKEK